MPDKTERTERGSVAAFVVLTFAATWASWFIAWIVSGGRESVRFPGSGFATLLFYLGVFSPAFVALALTARHEGKPGVHALLRRLVQWRVQNA